MAVSIACISPASNIPAPSSAHTIVGNTLMGSQDRCHGRYIDVQRADRRTRRKGMRRRRKQHRHEDRITVLHHAKHNTSFDVLSRRWDHNFSMTWPRAIQQSARSRLKAATRPTTPWSYPKMLATLVALPPSHRYHQHYDRQTVHAVHPTYLQRSDNPVTNRKDDCDSSRLSMLDERDAQKAARHDAHSCEAAMLSRPGAGVAQDAHHKAVDRTTSIFDRLWHSYSCIGAIDRPASLRRTLDPDTLFIGLARCASAPTSHMGISWTNSPI